MSVGHKLDARGGAGSWRELQAPTSSTRTTAGRACSAGSPGAAPRRPRASIRSTACLRRSRRGSAARTTRLTRQGVRAGRLAWLEHGYLPIEAGLTALGHVVAPSQAMADFMVAHGFAATCCT